MKVDLQINQRGLQQATSSIRSLTTALSQLRGSASRINLSVNTSGLAAAQRQIAQLQRQAQQAGAMPRGGGFGGFGGAGGYGRYSRYGGFGAGFGAGLGGFGGVVASMGAVEAAGYAAAASLIALTKSGAERDRTNLQLATLASQKQREIFESMPQPTDMPMKLTDNQYNSLRASLLPDVGGDEGQRAAAATTVANELIRNYVPRLYAQNPTKTKDEILEKLQVITKAINIGSTDITETVRNPQTGKDETRFTDQGRRVMQAALRAMAVDPAVTPDVIKTSLANAKTLALTGSEDTLARLFINTAQRGQREANEQYRAIRAITGTMDVKSLNEFLVTSGMFEEKGGDVKRKPTRKGKGKGAVQPGANTPIGGGIEKWMEFPELMFRRFFVPKMLERLKGKDYREQFEERERQQEKENEAAKREGREPKQISTLDLTPNEIGGYLDKYMPGLNNAARTGIMNYISGFDQTTRALNQSLISMQQDVPKSIKDSWTAQSENFWTALRDQLGNLAEMITKGMNLSGIIEQMTANIRDNPIGTAIGTALTTALLARGALALTGAIGTVTVAAATFTGAITIFGLAAALLDALMPKPAGKPNLPFEVESKNYADAIIRRQRAQEALKGATDAADIANITSTIEYYTNKANEALTKLNGGVKTLVDNLDKIPRPAQDGGLPDPEAPPPLIEKSDLELLEDYNRLVEQQRRDREIRQRQRVMEAHPPDWYTDIVKQLGDLKEAPPLLPGGMQPQDLKAPPESMIDLWKRLMGIRPMPEPVAPPKEGGKDPSEPIQLPEIDVKPSDLTEAASSFNTASATFSTSVSSLGSVFTYGASAIGSSGQVAADTLINAAPGIGSAIGSATASAIQAAVSGLSINVNANVVNASGGNPGTQSASSAA